jgi:ribosome-associated protein
VTASRVEAIFDVAASKAVDDRKRARLLERAGPIGTAVSQDARGQARNRRLALERLAAKLAAALAEPRSRTPTRPTRAARERRLESKRRAGERKRSRRRPWPEDE